MDDSILPNQRTDAPLDILLVDDETGFRESVAQRLQLRGISPRTAGSGEECLEIMASQPAPVLVLDVRLPGMNGLETLRRLKDGYPDAEVVLITGHATTSDGVQGMKDGAFDYLIKPVEIDQLARKVRQAHDTVIRREERRREAAFRTQVAQRMAETERLASLGTLAAGVAHEINNPVAIMIQEAEWLMDLLQDDDQGRINPAELRQSLQIIQTQGNRCREITHNLLHFARKAETRRQSMSLNAMVMELREIMERQAAKHHIILEIRLAPNLPELVASPSEIQQILLNLVNNAISAMEDKGGRIQIATAVEVRADIGKTLLLRVEDTGPGIAEADISRIFDPFFTTKPVGKGTGLGLSVCYGIVARMGGDISVQSAPDQGAAFSVHLPLQAPGITPQARPDPS
ncbi:response regulator [Pseudodesulfovibrio sp. F-1]|uniref:histidine kinase n=1 Tax=Pseudodesulfovibrio alkaliphilus TaxID=2661613 RepID=A0A7K1KJH2_9BACT|nr:ATP-binding protein [Pseudodesulfovibrio alkaliphilus]MUM76032.1 response regulator [Pseudodesulfovibrio alkaliphilus]